MSQNLPLRISTSAMQQANKLGVSVEFINSFQDNPQSIAPDDIGIREIFTKDGFIATVSAGLGENLAGDACVKDIRRI